MLPYFLSDISVITASVPEKLNGAATCGALWQAAPGRFLIDIPDVARYLVEGGNSIIIDPLPGADQTSIVRMLKTTPLAALLYQRGIMAFHAAAIAKGDDALLLSGDSGTGKSTLLAALLQRDWTVLADDLAIVALDAKRRLVVHSFAQDILLWPDSLQKLGVATTELKWSDSNRQILPLPSHCAPCPCFLRTIYWLGVHRNEEIEVQELFGGEKFRALGSLSYNSHIADALFDRVTHMQSAALIAERVAVRRLYRPRGEWTVAAIADLIEGEVE